MTSISYKQAGEQVSRKHPEDTRDDAHIRNELVTCAGTGKAIYFFLYSWKKIILVDKKNNAAVAAVIQEL